MNGEISGKDPAPRETKELKDALIGAQKRVFVLQGEGISPSSKEVRGAMNRLMNLIRRATPQDLAAFERWLAEERQRRSRP